MGGDGTMNEVLNGVGARVPLGVLPCGGTSVLARAMGLSREPTAAAGQIGRALAEGRETHLRLRLLNGPRVAVAARPRLRARPRPPARAPRPRPGPGAGGPPLTPPGG